MVTAIVKNGVLVPREPLPADWTEGTEVEVDKPIYTTSSGDEIDRWIAELDAIAAEGDPEDDRRLEAVLLERRREQRELARKKAGLPE